MPAILERLVSQLQDKGHSKSAAYAIATSQLEKHGLLNKQGEATSLGKERGAMTPEERAKSRQAKYSGHKESDFKYNAKTNRATLKYK